MYIPKIGVACGETKLRGDGGEGSGRKTRGYRRRREERKSEGEEAEEKGEAVAAQDDGRTGSHEDHCGKWWEAAEAPRRLIGRDEENDVRADSGCR